MTRFQNKVVLVTGGARGQGAAEARLLVAEGAKVVIGDVLEAEGRRLASELGSAAVFLRHDVTDELAAYKLASLPFPGVFGVFYQNDRPTKNALEKKWIDQSREKAGNASDVELLQKTFDRMK